MRILLATDGSPSAQAAIDLVAGRPWAPEAVVRLVAVDDAYGEERAELAAHVEAAAAQLRATDLQVETAIWSGRAASILLADARTWAADLVAVGSRGRGRVESLVLGSVSAEIVERAPASVLVVRRPRVQRLLVAVDGSPASRSVAPFLCATGAFERVSALVVSVSRDAEPWPPNLDLIAARAATRAADQLGRCAVRARRELLVGEPAATIVRCASEDNADLIALGSRGLSGLRRLLIGSVARNVTWSADGNVLIVRRRRSGYVEGVQRRRSR
jgi:nucleotide-binding universal stress UspA family protein